MVLSHSVGEEMKMFEILVKEFRQHKKFVLAYVAVCVFAAFFFGPFLSDVMPHAALASEGVEAELLSEGDTLLTLNDMILGGTFRRLAGNYSSVIGLSAEPFTGLLFLGIMQNIDKLSGNPLRMPEVPVGHPAVLAVVLVCFIASKFMKANESTKVFGICTLGYLEKFLGTVCVVVIGILSVVGVATGMGTATVNAAAPGEIATTAGHYAVGIVSAIFAVFMAIMSLIVNYIVKTVMLGLDALQGLISFIPLSGVVCEFVKSFLVLALFMINVVYPAAGYVVNIIVFLIFCLLFRVCYDPAQYLKKIYIQPFFKGIFGYKEDYPLVKRHIPFRVKRRFKERLPEIKAVIPMYTIKKPRKFDLKLRLYERVWMVCFENESGILFRKYNGERNAFYVLNSTEEAPVYLRKGFRFFELYTHRIYHDGKKHKFPRKEMDFVFTREYRYRFDELIAITGWVNVNEEKLSRRQQKKEERKQAILQAKETVSEWWADKIAKVKGFFKKDKEPIPVEADYTEDMFFEEQA
jgi:hypothetical protein